MFDGREGCCVTDERRTDDETKRVSREERHRASSHGRESFDHVHVYDPYADRFHEEDLGDEYYEQLTHTKQNPVSRIVNQWVDRLVGGVEDRSFADQEAQYAAHRTKRDYVWNTIGVGLWGMVFPILTIIVTQLVGAEQAGLFSLAFVTGTLLMFIANYGVRTFQVSDIDEDYSFADYQINRILTCIIMLVVGFAYCMIRGYAGDMFVISMGIYVYRMIDGLADVYEGRLQQADKMYLAGISQAFRSALAFVVFTVVLVLTRSLVASCILMAVAAVFSFIVLTLPLAYMETPRSRRGSLKNVNKLLKLCFPLFFALFFYNLIDNMPKFLMEGALAYENQLYFNAIYFPAHSILLIIGMVYKPLLLRLSEAWDDPAKHKQFLAIIGAVMGADVAATLVMMLLMGWIGIPIMSVLYGIDFEQFRYLVYIMIMAGGLTAAIEFLYQVITVQRRQSTIVKLYLATFVFSIAATLILVHTIGLMGAVLAYLLEMLLLVVLLILQFANIKRSPGRAIEGVGQSWY